MTPGHPCRWPAYLQKAVNSLNTQVSDSHHFQPAYLFHGHRIDPIHGPIIDATSSYYLHLKLASSIINFDKHKRASNYQFRTIPTETPIQIKYDHGKNATSLDAKCIQDLGPNHSSILAKAPTHTTPIRVHKSDVFISKFAHNFAKIFPDLHETLIPEPCFSISEI